MPQLRTIECDVCGQQETETDNGAGWQGWSIIRGIAAHKPADGQPLTAANMETCLCPLHTAMVAEAITILQDKAKEGE